MADILEDDWDDEEPDEEVCEDVSDDEPPSESYSSPSRFCASICLASSDHSSSEYNREKCPRLEA